MRSEKAFKHKRLSPKDVAMAMALISLDRTIKLSNSQCLICRSHLKSLLVSEEFLKFAFLSIVLIFLLCAKKRLVFHLVSLPKYPTIQVTQCMSIMSDPKSKVKGASDSLSNRDTIELPDDLSLSDSDPDEPNEHFVRKVEDLSSSSEEEGDAHYGQHVSQENPTFKLTGGSSGFCDRSKDIFAQLDSAAKITSKQLGEDNILDGTFARPAPPSPPQAAQRKCASPEAAIKKTSKNLPDYLEHPERWTHYSLEDVSETSDRKNSQAAHQYLQGLQDRKRSQDAVPETLSPALNQGHSSSSYENKIVFNKPQRKDRSENKPVHVRKGEVGLQHLDDGEENEGDAAAPLPHLSSRKNEEKKRKWVTEEDKEEDKKVPGVVFNSKKLNRKHFRKALGDDEGK